MSGAAAIDLHQHTRRQHLHRTRATLDNEARRQRSRATAARTDCRFDEKIMFEIRTRGHADQGVMAGGSAKFWRDTAVRRLAQTCSIRIVQRIPRLPGGKADPDHDHG